MKHWWQKKYEESQDAEPPVLQHLKTTWKIDEIQERRRRSTGQIAEPGHHDIYQTPIGNQIPRRRRGKRSHI